MKASLPQTNQASSYVKKNRGNYFFFHVLWNSKLYQGNYQWLIIAIALIPLLLVQQVSSSMIEGISERIIETDSYHIIFQPYDNKSLIDKPTRAAIMYHINTIDKHARMYPEIRGAGILRKGNAKTGISMRGVSKAILQDEGFRKYLTVVEGDLVFDKDNSIILGKAVASNIDAKVGDTVLLLTTRSDNINALPKISRNVVVGIVSTGYEELDRSWVFTSLERATALIPAFDQQWLLGVKIQDPFILENALVVRSKLDKAQGTQLINSLRNKVLPYGRIHTWYSLYYNRYVLFIGTKRTLSMVMFIAVLLAAVILSSTMSMKVIDMDTPIAMLKSIGANPKQLERQVFLQGLISGGIGSIIGGGMSIFLLSQINNIIFLIDSIINGVRYIFGFSSSISILNPQYYLSEIPFNLYFFDVLWVVGLATILAVLAAWIPIRRIRKISPLKILRQH